MSNEKIIEIVNGFGHENILPKHKTTIEFTKDAHLTKNGDCIVAVSTDRAPSDLSQKFKMKLRDPHTKLIIKIQVGELSEEIQAYGDPKLELTHPTDIVIRKSTYISDRTIAIRSDKSAKDLSRKLVEKLKNNKQKVKITLIAES